MAGVDPTNPDRIWRKTMGPPVFEGSGGRALLEYNLGRNLFEFEPLAEKDLRLVEDLVRNHRFLERVESAAADLNGGLNDFKIVLTSVIEDPGTGALQPGVYGLTAIEPGGDSRIFLALQTSRELRGPDLAPREIAEFTWPHELGHLVAAKEAAAHGLVVRSHDPGSGAAVEYLNDQFVAAGLREARRIEYIEWKRARLAEAVFRPSGELQEPSYDALEKFIASVPRSQPPAWSRSAYPLVSLRAYLRTLGLVHEEAMLMRAFEDRLSAADASFQRAARMGFDQLTEALLEDGKYYTLHLRDPVYDARMLEMLRRHRFVANDG